MGSGLGLAESPGTTEAVDPHSAGGGWRGINMVAEAVAPLADTARPEEETPKSAGMMMTKGSVGRIPEQGSLSMCPKLGDPPDATPGLGEKAERPRRPEENRGWKPCLLEKPDWWPPKRSTSPEESEEESEEDLGEGPDRRWEA